MTMLQLDVPIPVEVIGKGKGMALGWIDYGTEHHLQWIVAIDETREVWVAPNPKVRVRDNWSMSRAKPE
jgi:hypothetical protein